MRGDVYYIVNNPVKFGSSELIKLLNGMAMGVENSGWLICIYLVHFSTYLLNKSLILDGRISLQLFKSLGHIGLVIDIEAKH